MDGQFHFVGSQIIVLDTREEIEGPEDLVDDFAKMSLESSFYNIIDSINSPSH
ncbi:MAG: DUF5752 family protein [Desulfomonilaceae bacterium]